MGQKVNPRIFRIGTTTTWHSRWFAKSDYRQKLRQDIELRKYLKVEMKDAAVDHVEIERSSNKVNLIIFSGKPGIVIGRGGKGIEELKTKIQKKFFDKKEGLSVSVEEVADPNLSAELLVQSIASDIERRIPFRRAMKQALGRVERAGAKGAKILVSGRLNGAEIARAEKVIFGSIPLHTIKANIDYSRGVARTTYGAIGVKVWIFKNPEQPKESKKPFIKNRNFKK